MTDHTEVIEAAEAAKEALEALYEALTSDREAYTAVRGSGGSTDLGQPPYSLRNFVPDLEGAERGGWLMGKDEAFVEQLQAFIDWVSDDGESKLCPECESAQMHEDDHVWICSGCGYETSEPDD
jgi:hypothetical protein